MRGHRGTNWQEAEKLAPTYDKLIKFPEKWLFAGGRDWVCSQATGNVLEIAVGTGLASRSSLHQQCAADHPHAADVTDLA
jgi:hypothetical protein